MEWRILVKDWGIKDEMCDEVARQHSDYVFHLHQKSIEDSNDLLLFATGHTNRSK